LSCAIAPSMRDASPPSLPSEHATEREIGQQIERRTASPQGQLQRLPSEMLIHPSPNAWPVFGAKERFHSLCPAAPQRVSRSKVNAQVGGAQFTGIYKLCVRVVAHLEVVRSYDFAPCRAPPRDAPGHAS
jgi:hypothetical protein